MSRGQRAAALIALVFSLIAWTPATSTLASHESRDLVPAGRLDDQPARGVVLLVTAGRTVCTGFVIAARKVATAGHCLVRDAEDGDFTLRSDLRDQLVLYRAFSRVAADPLTFPPCRVARAWAHPRFVRSSSTDLRYGSRSHDYGVVTTRRGCSYPRNAFLGLRANTVAGGEMPDGVRISLMGYPYDPRFARMDGQYLWRSTGHVIAILAPPTRLYVTGFVARGMSGAPVLRVYGSPSPCGRATCVTGILTECEVNDDGLCRLGLSPRGAVRLTPEVRKALLSH
jgi:V8-like Glu-specific endopeptidase